MATTKTVFDFRDYRAYLADRLPTKGPLRGQRSLLAKAVRCQTAFVSQVLHGMVHFSFEQAIRINEFLNHTEVEADYFLLLLHFEKAGSKELENYYLKKIRVLQEERAKIAERIQVKASLNAEDQMRYYSAWYYSGIHILVSIPGFGTPQAIAQHFQLPLTLVSEVLEFLARIGMISRASGEYRFSSPSLHLPHSSPMVIQHHSNWRVRAISTMQAQSSQNLFFSGPISLSRRDSETFREILLKFLEEQQPFISKSEQEAVFCFNFDYFEVGGASKK